MFRDDIEGETYEGLNMEASPKDPGEDPIAIEVVIAFLALVSMVVFFFIFFESFVFAGEINQVRAVNAIIGEAEGEGATGMEAVACAIRNRGTLNGVYGEHAPRVTKKMYNEKTYWKARSAWVVSENKARCDALIDGADHWEGTKFQTPYWAEDMIVTATIGNQRFYRRAR